MKKGFKIERTIKIEVHQLKTLLQDKDFKAVMEWNKNYSGDGEDVKVIRKAIKKLSDATFNNVADKVKELFGVIKLRRLLDTYEDIEWEVEEQKHKGRGRPTKNYVRIKK